MQANSDANRDSDDSQREQRSNFKYRPAIWFGLGGIIIVGIIFLVSWLWPNLAERTKFFTQNVLSALTLYAIAIQVYFYTKHWEAMLEQRNAMKGQLAAMNAQVELSRQQGRTQRSQVRQTYKQVDLMRDNLGAMQKQVEIMGIAVEPRLRVANVRATNFVVGGLPIFIVTFVNEGATEARNVEIKLELQKGDETPVFWTRQQNVTIPANGKEDYPIRWPSLLRREDIDGFNDNIPLRVLGYFVHQTTTTKFCYRYYPWSFGNRPEGLPQFFPCDFDPGLTVTMTGLSGNLGLAGALNMFVTRKDQKQETEEPDINEDSGPESPNSDSGD